MKRKMCAALAAVTLALAGCSGGSSYAGGTVSDETGGTNAPNAKTYTVIFDANGGTGSMESQSFTIGTEQPLAANAFTLENNVFAGWNTDKGGAGNTYADGASVKDLAADGATVRLYAQWTPGIMVDAQNIADALSKNIGDTYTIQLTGEWTDDDLKSLGEELRKITGKNITLDLTATGIKELQGISGSSFEPFFPPTHSVSVFADCTALVAVLLPDTLETIGSYAFSYCTSLAAVTIPASVTKIGECAFQNCKSLESITIPYGVTSIEDSAFEGCTSLAAVTISAGVESIGNWAFYNCTSLTSVTIPDSMTTIGDRAFSDCISLTSVTIPDSVKRIGNTAFWSCKSLTNVTIGDSVDYIGNNAFSYCSSLTSITIPASVKTIGLYVFSDGPSFEEIIFKGTTEQWNGITKGLNWNPATLKVVICDDGEVFL